MRWTTIFGGLLIFLILVSACDPETLFRNAPTVQLINVTPGQVNPFDTVYAEVNAVNPEEGALSYQWSISPEAGTFLDPADQRTTRWTAPTSGGVYTFKIVVSNDYKSAERSASVTVIEPTIPLVKISSPEDGDYFVQGQEIRIEVEARHSNGINKIRLFVRDSLLIEESGNPSNNYLFTFRPDSSYLGQVEIKLEAIANFTAVSGTDSIYIFIEGILPKTPLKDNKQVRSPDL